jgi:hypothetical protein
MELSSGIAYAVGLTHEIYAHRSTAKWYFMMFRVVELFNRVKEQMLDETTQVVVLVCFQIIAKEYKEPLLGASFWTHALFRMEMKLGLVKKDEELELVQLRILEAVNGIIVPVGGAGDLPLEGTMCRIHFNAPHRFAVETAWQIDYAEARDPKTIRREVVVSMNR